MLNIKKILVPTDFSDNAEQAFSHARDLAKALGASVELVHVHQNPLYTGAFGYGTVELPPAYEEETRKAVVARLEEQREAFGNGVKVSVTVLEGTPFDELVRYAAQENADLIVMATHGYTGLKHVLLGSTAERVVRHAPCPVLTVRPTQ